MKSQDLNIRSESGSRVAAFGILLGTALAIIKISAGILGSSSALIADGIESCLDVLSSLTLFSSFKLISSDSLNRYPFGLGRVEPLAALAISLFILSSGVGIVLISLHEIQTPHRSPEVFTAIILVFVIIIKEIVYRKMIASGKSLESSAIKADAWHHRVDGLTSLVALAGILISILLGPGYEMADDWAALAACTVIFYNGFRLVKESVKEIIDISPYTEKLEDIKLLAIQVPGVLKIDKCRVRKAGIYYFVDIHIVVSGTISVREGHNISHDVKNKLLETNTIKDIIVHVEPDDPERLNR